MADQYLFRFDEEGLDRIIERVEAFRRTIREVGQAGELGDGFQRFFNQFIARTRQSNKVIADLRGQVQQLMTLSQQMGGLEGRIGPAVRQRLAQPDIGIDVKEGATFRAEIEKRVAVLLEEQARLQQILVHEQERLNQEKQRAANLAEIHNRLETGRARLLEQVRDVRPGGGRAAQLVLERENALLERQRELRQQLSEELARFQKVVPREANEILNREVALSTQIAAARKRQAEAEREVVRARKEAASAGLGPAGDIAGAGPTTEQERVALLERQEELRRTIAAALEEEVRATLALQRLEQEREANLERMAAIESGNTGMARGVTEILDRLREVNDLIAEITVTSDALGDTLGPGVAEGLAEVEQILASFEGRDIKLLSPEEVEQLATTQARARELLQTVEQFPQQGIPLKLNEEELMQSMSLLNRLMLGAARDFARRFTATIQFALSAALLFGTQRLIREFFSAAIEVERTFADISTSLQFNIEAERGTAEFERQLERVRRQVLQIADDFNALPAEINTIAFQMISRFQDVEAAIIATRAQVLATRVAVDDQADAMRALTGVAEAFGLSLAGIDDAHERQIRQAQLYASALDKATALQQQFGVALDETLKGAAGVAELFRTLGFTMDETFAIVSATILRTGQTGQQVADRLGRAFSALATPQLRDELVSLANQFDDFFLRPADFFESGQNAFFVILDQFADLDDKLQTRIAQIIGQRRETAFISALLQAGAAGEIDRAVDALSDSAGVAEDRLLVLLATVRGSMEGIGQQFQELAQNFERLGVMTPVRLLLGGLELVLRTVNAILKGVLRLVEALNSVRITENFGLGSALTAMIALVTVAASLRTLLAGIRIVASAKGATTLIDVFRSIVGFGGRETGAGVKAAQASSFLGISTFIQSLRRADDASGRSGGTLRNLFIAPLTQLPTLFNNARIAISSFITAHVTSRIATLNATRAEAGLTLARARTALVTGILALRSMGVAGILARLGPMLGTLVARLGGIQGVVLGVAGAVVTLGSAFGVLRSVIERIFGDETRPSRSISERQEELRIEAESAGRSVTAAELRIQAVNERLNELGEALDGLLPDLVSFGVSIFGPLLDVMGGREAMPLTREHFQREIRRTQLELAFAETQQLQEELNRLNVALGGATDDIAPALQDTQQFVNDILNALVGIDADSPDETDLVEVQALIEQAREIFESLVPELFDEWGKILTAAEIRDEISNLQSRLQLGFETVASARVTMEELRQNALAGLADAEEFGDPEAAREMEQVLLQLALADQRFFEQERDERLRRTNLIEDNRTRLLAELRILRDFAVAAANNPNLGPQAVIDAQQAVADAEREFNAALRDEAIARLRFQADSARTFRDRIAALQALFKAIQAQIAERKRQTAAALVPEIGGGIVGGVLESVLRNALITTGVVANTAAEDAQLQAILDQIADEQMRHARLVARNSTLKNKSALDNIAAIAATVNALRAEISLLRKRQVEEQEIIAKEIELREALAQQRLAEADRRAAFFRLTAGTGDDIKAAQAELRAALDRLATIEALGGADTQAGYEAELAVLQARRRLVEMALRMSDARRRVAADVTDSFAQALLDVHAAQEALRQATGEIEQLEAEIALREAESRAQREFYDRRLSDLDFLFQTDQIGRSQYISALRSLQAGIDRTTRQGEELWRQIELQIRGLMDSADQAFNIPTEIRLPTLFEVRRALAADALGVNYQDMRNQEINIFVSDEVDVNAVIKAIDSAFGSAIDLEAQRLASGGAGITIGGFS